MSRHAIAIAFASLTTLAACGPGEVDVFEMEDLSDSKLDAGTSDAGSTESDAGNAPAFDTGAAATEPDAGAALDASSEEVLDPELCPNVVITAAAGIPLNVRPAPNTNQDPVGAYYRGTVVEVLDEVTGQPIDGNDVWYEVRGLGTRGFVTARYAECTTEPVTRFTEPEGFYLPLECDKSARVSQGNNGSFSHNGRHQYAWDFSLPLGTPMTAIADGMVLHTYAGTAPGSACDGGGQSCAAYANHVVLLHGDDTTSTYRHLSRVDVEVGQFVPRGVVVGLSGQTGWSTGPHAHVMRMENCGSAFPPTDYVCQSIPTKFKDVSVNGGVPRTGDTVKSGNCVPLR